MDWHKVIAAEEQQANLLPVNGLLQVKINGKKICLARNQDGYFAVQNNCPHASGDLSLGWCEGSRIICPLHRYAYDLKTGRGIGDQGDAVRTYPVEQREDGLYLGLKDPWSWLKS